MIYNNIRLLKIIYIVLSILYIINFSNKIIDRFNNNNIPIYVVSLERSCDRREYINNLLKDVKFNYFDAIDGKAIKPHDMYLIKEFVHPNYEKKYTKGQLGCLLSHIKLLKQIIENNNHISLILEDDIVLRNNLNIRDILKIIKKIDNIEEYDTIFLGHCYEEENNKITDTVEYNNTIYKIFKSVKPQCTHAYIITKKGAHTIMNSIKMYNYKINNPIDVFYRILIKNNILKSLSFSDTLINQPWQELQRDVSFASLT